jgi:hypothetical protein
MTLLEHLWDLARHPLDHPQTLAFAGLYTLLLSAVYLMVLSFTQLQQEHRRN